MCILKYQRHPPFELRYFTVSLRHDDNPARIQWWQLNPSAQEAEASGFEFEASLVYSQGYRVTLP